MLSMSLKPSGVEQPECVALYCEVFSLVQVIWTRRWCSELPPPPLAGLSRSPPSVSSSSSDPMLVSRSIELRSFTSWALIGHTNMFFLVSHQLFSFFYLSYAILLPQLLTPVSLPVSLSLCTCLSLFPLEVCELWTPVLLYLRERYTYRQHKVT